jgi:hypothetical protein
VIGCPSLPLVTWVKVNLVARPLLIPSYQKLCSCEYGVFTADCGGLKTHMQCTKILCIDWRLASGVQCLDGDICDFSSFRIRHRTVSDFLDLFLVSVGKKVNWLFVQHDGSETCSSALMGVDFGHHNLRTCVCRDLPKKFIRKPHKLGGTETQYWTHCYQYWPGNTHKAARNTKKERCLS